MASLASDFPRKFPGSAASDLSVTIGGRGSGGAGATAATATTVTAAAETVRPDGALDDSLLRRVAGGERAAFDRLVELYQPRVERLALRLLGWRSADVEDVVQDVFLAAFTKAGRVRGDGGAAAWAWLATITVNACRTRHRRNGVFDKLLARLSMRASQHAPPRPAKAETDETLAQVRDAIERLGGSEREVVVLHCLEGMRLGDVAEVLGISGNAVQIRLHRARQRLKHELDGKT